MPFAFCNYFDIFYDFTTICGTSSPYIIHEKLKCCTGHKDLVTLSHYRYISTVKTYTYSCTKLPYISSRQITMYIYVSYKMTN